MSAEVATDIRVIDEPTTQDADHIWHVFCISCWPKPTPGQIAMCGTPRPVGTEERGWWDRPETVCVVCDELIDTPCRVCGS